MHGGYTERGAWYVEVMREPYDTELQVNRPEDLGGGQWELSGLTAITVLFGKNGSGKSRLLRALRDLNTNECHYVVPERAGEMDYQAGHVQEQMQPDTRRGAASRNFSENYRRQIVARIQAYFTGRGDWRGEGTPPARPEQLEQLLAPLIPDFDFTLSGREAPPYRLLRAGTQVRVGNIDQLSSGEAQILTLALDILLIAGIWEVQQTGRRLVLIDEPDAHIHPDLQVRFADFLVQAAKTFDLQVLVASHSTTLLAALGQFAGTDASVLYLDRNRTRLRAEPFNNVLRELSACLGGHALMGPLFGAPLLLVEGDDEYRIWSQVPRHHQVNFSVIPAGGDEIKRYQKSLERVFSALRDEEETRSGFALIDGDKGKPNPDANNPQNHIRYIQLGCHESENLYLTDEVLALFGLTWQQAQAKLDEVAPECGGLVDQIHAVVGCDRRTADIKTVVQALSEILDPKKVLWTIRVAQVLGRGRPTGQIGEFLGGEVVEALWGAAPTEQEHIRVVEEVT